MTKELSETDVAQYNALYNRALRLARRHLLIDGEPQTGHPGWLARRQLRKGVTLFEQALKIAPFKWEGRFWIGKALQRLGDHKGAMTWFMDALKAQPDNPTIAMEAANEAAELGEFELGVGLLRPAAVQQPRNAALRHNLAIHQLLAGRPKEAFESLEHAARLEVRASTGRFMSYVEAVLAGRVPCPKTLVEVKQNS